MNPIDWLLHSQVTIAGSPVLVREIVGNVFGLASALFGMRRLVAAWPVGIVGNVLLFTVFVGGIFDTPQDKDLWGQAGRWHPRHPRHRPGHRCEHHGDRTGRKARNHDVQPDFLDSPGRNHRGRLPRIGEVSRRRQEPRCHRDRSSTE